MQSFHLISIFCFKSLTFWSICLHLSISFWFDCSFVSWSSLYWFLISCNSVCISLKVVMILTQFKTIGWQSFSLESGSIWEHLCSNWYKIESSLQSKLWSYQSIQSILDSKFANNNSNPKMTYSGLQSVHTNSHSLVPMVENSSNQMTAKTSGD